MVKKKLLSLGLAATMSSTAGLTVFAAPITGSESQTLTSDMELSGHIRTSNDSAAEGTIEVEIPVAASFTVDKDSKLTAASFRIENKSAKPIEVGVKEFHETVASGGITIAEDNNFDPATVDRSNVRLYIVGQQGKVDLGAKLKDKSGTATKIARIEGGSSQTVQILGDAGTQDTSADPTTGVDAKGRTEKFKVVYEIKSTT